MRKDTRPNAAGAYRGREDESEFVLSKGKTWVTDVIVLHLATQAWQWTQGVFIGSHIAFFFFICFSFRFCFFYFFEVSGVSCFAILALQNFYQFIIP